MRALEILEEVLENSKYKKETSELCNRNSKFFDATFTLEIDRYVQKIEEAIDELQEYQERSCESCKWYDGYKCEHNDCPASYFDKDVFSDFCCKFYERKEV